MPTLYQGDRKIEVAMDEVNEFMEKGWSKSKESISPKKVEEVAEEVAEEPAEEPAEEEPKGRTRKQRSEGTKNRFKTRRG
jgi:hypothetical protein